MHLRQNLNAIRRECESNGAADLEALEALRSRAFKSFLESERSRIVEMHRGGALGGYVVAEWTTAVDTIIGEAYRQALLDDHEGRVERYAVIAQGGYGRGVLNPRSDVDLLFLYSRNQKGDPITRYILHLLWDLDFDVGHSTRTIGECIEEARRDSDSRTAMLEGRYLAGDYRLFSRFEKTMEGVLLGPKASTFVHDKIEERRKRHLQAGMTVNLLEPNIKESPGGLRDIHTVTWILRASRGRPSLEGLIEAGLVSSQDYQSYEEAQDFLWRIRNELHFSAKKRVDVLEHDIQPMVAKRLGYKDKNGELGVERFMREYYLHARNINRLSSQICTRLDGQSTKVRRAVSYLSRRKLDDKSFLVGNRIQLPNRNPGNFFNEDPTRFLSVFHNGQCFDASISDELQKEIRAHLSLIDENLLCSEKARNLFFGILSEGHGAGKTLRLMHDMGVLGAYIPEFGTLTGLVQYNLYHIYTADEHTLLAIENLERLLEGKNEADSLLRGVAEEILRWDLLILGILLHDVGKSARSDDHTKVGVAMAKEFLDRIGTPERDAQMVLFLVENHLSMSNIAQRRDLNDPTLIADFAGQVEDVERLRMLYLLTYADLSAVTRTAWTTWKGYLLWELYYKTLEVLTHVPRDEGAAQKIVEALTPKFGRKTVTDHLDGLPDRYIPAVDPRGVEVHLNLIRFLKDLPAAIDFRVGEVFTEITVCTMDKPYRLSEICGILSLNDVNIFNALAYTRSDGVVLDIFQVTDVNGKAKITKNQQKSIEERLTAVSQGREDVASLLKKKPLRWSRQRENTLPAPTRVVFENNISEKYTVIDLFTPDAVGLMYKITRTLSDLELDIYTAKIGTQGDRAEDAFYVTDRSGKKIEDPERLKRIEGDLIWAVGSS